MDGMKLVPSAFKAPILLIAAALLCCSPQAFGAETVKVDKKFNGREIKVRAGATIQVELQQPGATGYSWEIQNLDTEHFKLESVRTEERRSSGDFTGAPIMKIWSLTALKEGKSKLKFLHYRSWEGEESANETFVLSIRILGTR
jgi:predicted secreted protein